MSRFAVGSGWFRFWLVAVFAAFGLPSCIQESLPEPYTPLTRLAGSPYDYVGQTTTVEGVVRYRYAPGVFVIGPDGNWPNERQRMLVVAPPSVADTAELHEGTPVRVSGVVRVVNRQSLANEFGAGRAPGGVPALGNNFYGEWDGRPAIDAEQVEVLPRLQQPKTGDGPGTAPGISA